MRSVFLTLQGPPRPIAIPFVTGRTRTRRPRPRRQAGDRRAARRAGQRIEEPADRGKLRGARFRRVDFAPEGIAADKILRIPAEMLAGNPHARDLAMESVMIVEVRTMASRASATVGGGRWTPQSR